jgi:hypothetical protein
MKQERRAAANADIADGEEQRAGRLAMAVDREQNSREFTAAHG